MTEVKKECRNCIHAYSSVLEWIFCREPIRMKTFLKQYQKGQVPIGGYPQSLNHSCSRWSFKGVKHTLNFPITYGFMESQSEKYRRANDYYLWRLFNNVMNKLRIK